MSGRKVAIVGVGYSDVARTTAPRIGRAHIVSPSIARVSIVCADIVSRGPRSRPTGARSTRRRPDPNA